MGETPLSAAEGALVSTIYSPPQAHRPWMLKDILPEGAVKFYALARWALVDGLRACGVSAGDCVMVPGLICREVLASINCVGATPAFYPVSPQLCAGFDPGVLGQSKAVLAVNYFGFPQELGRFRQYCERTGAVLIEDNAHGLLSRDENGQLLGSRGDIGIFSFRKTIAVPAGGALVLNGGQITPPDLSSISALSTRYRLKQAFRPVTRQLGAPVTLGALEMFRHVRRLLTGHAVPRSLPDAEEHVPAPPNPCELISGPLTVAVPALEASRRRALFDLAARLVNGSSAVPVFERLPDHVVPYGYPLFASPARAPALAATLRRHGLSLVPWPDLPAAIAPSAPEHYRDLMVVPFLW